jgi:hypothetical protein
MAAAAASALRTPVEIVDAVAARQQYVTPLQEHMPLSPAMARACVREAYADALRLLASAGADPARLAHVREQLTRMTTQK